MASRLSRVLSDVGVGMIRKVPVFMPIHAAVAERVVEQWCEVIRAIGANPVVVKRPIAAAAGLGLDMAGRTHLLWEMDEEIIEVAVVVDGDVTISQTIRSLQGGWRTALDAVTQMLASIDPDQELEIRDHGLHVYGAGGHSANLVAEMAGLRLATTSGDCYTVTRGAQVIAKDVLGWLRAT